MRFVHALLASCVLLPKASLSLHRPDQPTTFALPIRRNGASKTEKGLLKKLLRGLKDEKHSYLCTPLQKEAASNERQRKKFFEKLATKLKLSTFAPRFRRRAARKNEEKKHQKIFLRKLANRIKLLTFATPNGTTLGKHKKGEVVMTTTRLIQQELAYVL